MLFEPDIDDVDDAIAYLDFEPESRFDTAGVIFVMWVLLGTGFFVGFVSGWFIRGM